MNLDWEMISRIDGEKACPRSNYFDKDSVDKSRFSFWKIESKSRGVILPLYIYMPINKTKCKKVIFAIHGTKRNGKKYRNIFVNSLQKENILLISLEFDVNTFSSSLALTIGNTRQRINQLGFSKPNEWTFTYIREIFDFMKKEFPSITEYSLFGHSAGAQFVHRYMLFIEDPSLSVVVAANPGWLTFLDTELDFPYGVKGLLDDKDIKRVLRKKLILVAGEDDIKSDANLRVSKKALSQGLNRYERSRNAYLFAKKVSKRHSTSCNWEFKSFEGVGHSSSLIAPFAMVELLL